MRRDHDRRGRLLARCAAASTLGVLGAFAAFPSLAQEPRGAAPSPAPLAGPGPVPVDVFHADRQPDEHGALPPLPRPGYGGRAVLAIESMPNGLNLALDTSNVGLRVLHEVHETLMRVDWESFAWEPNLCRERVVEDSLFLVDGRRLFGAVEACKGGFVVAPRSRANPLAETTFVAADDVLRLERATVYTYALREDVLWHPVELADGTRLPEQRLDARDLVFSAALYANPLVRCDAARHNFAGVEVVALDPHTLRASFPRQHFRGDTALGAMTILPSHLYDLSDADNPAHALAATPDEQARAINESPYNLRWVGLGPYRVVEFGAQEVRARRFERYFDPERAGYLDEIRWRHVPDSALVRALLEGEVDFSARLSTADFFGPATEDDDFARRFTKGWYYGSTFGAVVWNLHRPELAEREVRQALAHAFDFDAYLAAVYRGQARQVTGSMPCFSQAYDPAVVPLAHDPARAEALLDGAGWYDRDGDGVREKDGLALAIELLMPANSASTRTLGLQLQQDLARIGVRLELPELEWATFRERQDRREFEALPIGLFPPLEPDPEFLWHSKNGARGDPGSNYSGLQDAEVDRLIEQGQRETDPAARMRIWRTLHARLYELQPCLFLFNVPMRFALARGLRGFQALGVDPYYSARRWYYALGTPGTRATLVPPATGAPGDGGR